MMVRTTFEKVERRATKRVPCAAGCGKKVARSKTFMQTLNPWNKDPETGAPRTRDQIWHALRAEAEAWKLLPEWCPKDRAP